MSAVNTLRLPGISDNLRVYSNLHSKISLDRLRLRKDKFKFWFIIGSDGLSHFLRLSSESGQAE
jgi:hypothetical protein